MARRTEKRNRTTAAVGAILRQSPTGIQARIEVTRQLLDAWETAVGHDWAQRGQPLRLDRGTLTIAIAEPIWAQEFDLMAHEIIERLRTALPALTVHSLRCEYSRPGAGVPDPAQRRPHRFDAES